MQNSDKHVFHYRRRLPHFQPKGATMFVTIRLHGSIPKKVLAEWRERRKAHDREAAKVENDTERERQVYQEHKRQFGRYDRYLDSVHYGATWLREPEVAQIVADSFHYLENEGRYDLYAFTIMSNHAHFLFTPLKKVDGSYHSLRNIMHSLKSFTANEANKVLKRVGEPFWQIESYDHVVRDEQEWRRIMAYIVNNPVKAGLVDGWDKWQWTYCRYELEL